MWGAAPCGEDTAGGTHNAQEVSIAEMWQGLNMTLISQIWFVAIETAEQYFPTHTSIQIVAFLIAKV